MGRNERLCACLPFPVMNLIMKLNKNNPIQLDSKNWKPQVISFGRHLIDLSIEIMWPNEFENTFIVCVHEAAKLHSKSQNSVRKNNNCCLKSKNLT